MRHSRLRFRHRHLRSVLITYLLASLLLTYTHNIVNIVGPDTYQAQQEQPVVGAACDAPSRGSRQGRRLATPADVDAIAIAARD